MTDRIVHYCERCGYIDWRPPRVDGTGRHLGAADRCVCDEPVTAINLDRLLRVERKVQLLLHNDSTLEEMVAELSDMMTLYSQADQAEPGEQQGG